MINQNVSEEVDRSVMHGLLDSVLDGGHRDVIEAMVLTMREYVKAIEVRNRLWELEKRSENLRISAFQRRLDRERSSKSKGN